MTMTDNFEFEGTLNDLQQALTETTRRRIQAENRLNVMKEDDEWRSFQIKFIEVCKSLENKLGEELTKRIPKGQKVIS